MKCLKCHGSGQVLDPRQTGQSLRLVRKKARLSIQMVAHHMGFTASYLYDLERGSRNWNDNLIELYKFALEKLRGKL